MSQVAKMRSGSRSQHRHFAGFGAAADGRHSLQTWQKRGTEPPNSVFNLVLVGAGHEQAATETPEH
jgi:hypothetical protein